MQRNPGETSQSASRIADIDQHPFRTRAISAVFIGAITVSAALAGDPWFTGLVFLAAGAATVEMIRLMRVSGFSPSLAFSLASLALAFAAARFPSLPLLPVAATTLILVSLAFQMRHRVGKPIADWAISLAGSAYLGWTGGLLAAVRMLNNGLWWLVIAIGVTWLADSCAYYVGRRLGRHKLAPVLSPKKTWEGYIGGIVGALLGGVAIGLISPLGMASCIVAAGLVGALGTLGDLIESMFKRQAGAKDSGNLIAGHGGAFDRIDSLLWAGVIVYYYAALAAH
ncbi:MAG: phosphatidate cytidylyltransferase [Chloroflexi bacterium]|nr:phosphatidate cytidylyltransferase [Chloroflexota bacterium]MCL5273927.1 phosphatidate cytidylyltransferase [Chloroflexota bacterium]